jgi:DNA-binding NtrC family response regulator
LLVEHFLAMYSREVKREGLTVSSEVMEIMRHHPWTGNIRELQNCIERAVILCDGREILPEHIGLRAPARTTEEGVPAVGSLQEASSAASRAVEAKMIEKVLRETGGNKTKAAEILQVSYKTLLTKIKDYGLDKE